MRNFASRSPDAEGPRTLKNSGQKASNSPGSESAYGQCVQIQIDEAHAVLPFLRIAVAGDMFVTLGAAVGPLGLVTFRFAGDRSCSPAPNLSYPWKESLLVSADDTDRSFNLVLLSLHPKRHTVRLWQAK